MSSSNDTVDIIVIDKGNVTPITPALESFLGPIPVDAFLKGTYQPTRDGNDFHSVSQRGGQGLPPKALAVKLADNATQEEREERLSYLKEHMYDFHPVRMLETSSSTASGGVNVWLTPDKSSSSSETPSKISTLKVDNAAKAALLYKSGHSLYFRASDELEGQFVSPLLKGLGHGIPSAMYYRDGQRRGEIETFASHIGHTTPWHWDFQENFTVQLRGSKTWYLYAGDDESTIPAPYRAMALHFGTASEATLDPVSFYENCRMQHMQHALHKNSSMGRFKGVLPDDVRERCVAVTLQPGDVLYHPAGVWHQVKTVPPLHSSSEASLSINVSLFPETYAEHVAEGLYHQMSTSFSWRQRMDCRSHADSLTQLALRRRALMESGSSSSAVVPAEMLPPALYATPRPYAAVATKDSGLTVLPALAAAIPQLAPTTLLVRNRLTVMTHTSSEPSFKIDPSDDDGSTMCQKLFSLAVRYTPDVKEAKAQHSNESNSDEESDEEDEATADLAPLQDEVIPVFQTLPAKGSKRARAEAELERRLKEVTRFDIHYNFVGGCEDGPLQDVLHCALFVEGSPLKHLLLEWAAFPHRPSGTPLSDLISKEKGGPSEETQQMLLSYLTYMGFFYDHSLPSIVS